jgi:hypothetical protein
MAMPELCPARFVSEKRHQKGLSSVLPEPGSDSNKRAGHFVPVAPVRLDVANPSLMPSSDCSQIGTGSSNPSHSATQSGMLPYIMEKR